MKWDSIGMSRVSLSKALQVKAGFLQREGWQATLCAVLLDMWRIPTFSASRWLTVGNGCRRLSLWLCTGGAHCFQFMLKAQHITEYYYGGLASYGSESALLSMVTALVALVPDAVLRCLLHEPQFCKLCLSLLDDLSAEVDVLENLSPQIWQWFCSHLHCDAVHLRNTVVHAALVSWGYMEGKMFNAVSALPWALAVGDLKANLEAVAACSECPADVVTGLQTMQCSSWTSQLTERQHASTAV
eukprot:6479286-Amphidinium_carterae.1